MADGPIWFAPKRHGYGSALPVAWQGWLLLIGYVAAVLAISLRLKNHPPLLIAAVIPLTGLFMIICARTTRGGWRRRWGKDD
jgi:hypothetical protein